MMTAFRENSVINIQKHRTLKRRIIVKKFLCFIAVVTACLICFNSCSVKFEYVDNQLLNKKTGEKYNALPIGFEPCGVGEEYGKFGEFILYKMTDIDGNEADPELWVTEGYAGGATTVFLNEKMPLPSFTEMNFDVFYICEEDQSIISIATVENSDEIAELVSAFEKDNETIWLGKADYTYTVKLYSAEYPAVFYSLNYYVTEDGNFLHDRGSDTYVNVGDMLSEYVVTENE